jgi:hypothetical protein
MGKHDRGDSIGSMDFARVGGEVGAGKVDDAEVEVSIFVTGSTAFAEHALSASGKFESLIPSGLSEVSRAVDCDGGTVDTELETTAVLSDSTTFTDIALEQGYGCRWKTSRSL